MMLLVNTVYRSFNLIFMFLGACAPGKAKRRGSRDFRSFVQYFVQFNSDLWCDCVYKTSKFMASFVDYTQYYNQKHTVKSVIKN